jgi:hypothetical protein
MNSITVAITLAFLREMLHKVGVIEVLFEFFKHIYATRVSWPVVFRSSMRPLSQFPIPRLPRSSSNVNAEPLLMTADQKHLE